VVNATFRNISAISWQPVLVVEEAGVPGENHILIRSSTILGENFPHQGHEMTSAVEFCIVINVSIT
jgi:hypothetical protein